MMPLIAQIRTAETEPARLTATRAALAYERDHPPGVLLWQGVGFDGVAKNLTDFVVEHDFVRWDTVRFEDTTD